MDHQWTMTTMPVWGDDTFRLVAHCCPKNKDFVFFGRVFVSVFNKSFGIAATEEKVSSNELWSRGENF